jgi:protein TonB
MNRILTGMGALALLAGGALAEVRVGTGEALKAAINKPQPEYSTVARQMKVAGNVEVEATVDTAGNVQSVKSLTGNPLLTQSAISAVQKWKFSPFAENGAPAKAVVTLTFDFRP